MSGGSLLVLAVLLCTLAEWITERFFGGIKQIRGWPMIFIGAGVGTGLCFGFGVDILKLVGFEASYLPWVGKLVSGLIIGGGSNALHKWVKPAAKK